MYCVSVSFKTADLDVRRKLAFSEEVQARFISDALSLTAEQCVVLCTCNRTEVYFSGDKETAASIRRLIAEYSGCGEDELARCVMRFVDDGALLHLFRTAAGLDSMVVGEDEILRQLKKAYELSQSRGSVGGDFNMIFQAAFACAKKIKTETALSKTSVSIATLAANEAARISAGNVNVLLIGSTGKTGLTVLKNLVSHKNVSVAAAVRSRGGGFEFVQKSTNVRAVDYSERYSFLDSADCIISATSSPHYTLTAGDVRSHIKTQKPRLFIDLAVPPDIDCAIGRLDGARLINIDYFNQLANENNARKADSAMTAEEIIERSVDDLKKELLFRSFQPYMEDVKKIGAAELLYRLKASLSSEEFSAVLNALSEG